MSLIFIVWKKSVRTALLSVLAFLLAQGQTCGFDVMVIRVTSTVSEYEVRIYHARHQTTMPGKTMAEDLGLVGTDAEQWWRFDSPSSSFSGKGFLSQAPAFTNVNLRIAVLTKGKCFVSSPFSTRGAITKVDIHLDETAMSIRVENGYDGPPILMGPTVFQWVLWNVLVSTASLLFLYDKDSKDVPGGAWVGLGVMEAFVIFPMTYLATFMGFMGGATTSWWWFLSAQALGIVLMTFALRCSGIKGWRGWWVAAGVTVLSAASANLITVWMVRG